MLKLAWLRFMAPTKAKCGRNQPLLSVYMWHVTEKLKRILKRFFLAILWTGETLISLAKVGQNYKVVTSVLDVWIENGCIRDCIMDLRNFWPTFQLEKFAFRPLHSDLNRAFENLLVSKLSSGWGARGRLCQLTILKLDWPFLWSLTTETNF